MARPEIRLEDHQFQWVGRLEKDDDGGYQLMRDYPLELRKLVAKTQRKPLRRVRKSFARFVQFHPSRVTEAEVERMLGQTVKLHLQRSRRGTVYATEIEPHRLDETAKTPVARVIASKKQVLRPPSALSEARIPAKAESSPSDAPEVARPERTP